ncbi:MAG: hypothetical protein AAGI48_04550 [Verrucomicrobiota bacterium]
MAVGDKIKDFRDDVGVKLIMNASEKMKRMNEELAEKGADVRVASFEFQPGTPPSLTFCVETLDQGSAD